MDTGGKELKILFWMIAVFAAVFFLPLGKRTVYDSCRCYPRPCGNGMHRNTLCCVCFQRSLLQVSLPYSSVRVPVLRYFGANAKMDLLYGCSRFWWYSCRMFMYHSAALYEYLQTGGRIGSGCRLPLFRSGNQYPVNYPDGTDSGF